MQPEELTLQQAQNSVTPAADRAHWNTTLSMLSGDHWLDGLGWVGPRLPANHPQATEFLAAVQQQFIPKNALKEVAGRHVGAVIGRYPIIKLALRDATAEPTDAQRKEMREAEGALTHWLDRSRALGKLQRFTLLLLLGRAHLQNYIPTGALVNGRVPPGDLLTSIRRIRLRVPEPGTAQVIDDESTGRLYAVYKASTSTGADATEITYLTPDGRTVTRRLEAGATGPVTPDGIAPVLDSSTDALDLHGHLTVTEAIRDQFLTSTLVKNNHMLNFAKTAILRNAELAAILERYGIGILPPGEWLTGTDGRETYKPDPDWRPGGGNVAFFGAQSTIDEQGRVQNAPGGQYGRFEPVNPDALIATKTDAYHDMLDEAGQGHIKGDATGPSSSGEARIQAMNDFKASLYATATPLESALADHLEMTLAWAAALSGKPGRFKAYRVVVQCRILAAQPTSAERLQIVSERDAGLRSTENAMSEIGIEDTDEMLAAVQAEQEAKLQQGQEAAAALGRLMEPAPARTPADAQP